jgi:hypothetical protein
MTKSRQKLRLLIETLDEAVQDLKGIEQMRASPLHPADRWFFPPSISDDISAMARIAAELSQVHRRNQEKLRKEKELEK